MNKEDYDKLSTFDKIEFDIEMKMYMEHNDKIASMYDNLGDVYSYKDLEETKSLEEHETLQEYKKVLKEKCEEIERLKDYKDLYKDLLNQSEDNIKQLIKKLNEYKSKIDKTTNYYLKTLAKNGNMPDEAVEMFNLLEGNK